MTTKIKTGFPGFTLAASILGLAFTALPSFAAIVPPALQISVSPGVSVTIDSTGTQTYGASCTSTLCPPGSVTVASGSITWSGTIGNFTLSTVVGHTKPLLTQPNIDLGVGSITTTAAAGGTITIEWTDTGFTVGETPGTMTVAPGAVGSAVYTSYVDNTNAAFGTGIKVGSTTTGGIVSGPGPSANPFSMTNVEVVTLPAGVGTSAPPFLSDFQLQVAPHPPLALSCTSLAAGTVGVSYSSLLSATGGVPAYTFSISSGSISPLVLNSSTGAITGTPSTSGTLSFTAKVVDSSGNTAANTATASCSIVVSKPKTTPPLTVTCPTSSAVVGTYYSSTVGVTGGVPPYKYAIAFGSLPNGLTLNTSTGTITGTPTTAQTGSFKIEVTDSTGAIAYTNCSGSCSGGVQVTYGGTQPQSGYGDKGTSCAYSSNGIPLNVYGYSTGGSPCDLYSSYVSGGPSLGLANSSNSNQIDTGHFVQFDISGNNSSGATGTSINVTSTEGNATFDVYGSNTKGSLGTLLSSNVQASLSGYQSIPNANNYHYICVKAHQGDVAVACLQFTYTCACAIDVTQSQSQCNSNQNGNDWWGGNNGNNGNSNGSQGSNPGQCGW